MQGHGGTVNTCGQVKETSLKRLYTMWFQLCDILEKAELSLGAQTVKNLPVIWETRVQPRGQEDLLEKGMATHSSILAWRIPWTEEPGGLQSMGSQRVGYDWNDLAHVNGHNQKINGFQGLVGKGWIGTSQGCLGQWNSSVGYHSGGHTWLNICSTRGKYRPRMKPGYTVDSGWWWLVNIGSWVVTSVSSGEDVNNGGGGACGEGGAKWEMSVPSPFFCEHKTALKIKQKKKCMRKKGKTMRHREAKS